MKRLALALLTAAAALLPACADHDQAGTLAIKLDSWTDIHQSVIVPSCAFASCHAGAQPAAHLDLALPASCAQLVGRASCLFPQKTLVLPTAPENSFLISKLTGEGLGTPPDTTCGGASNQRMPFGAQPLPPEQIAAIKAWIASGADCDGGGSPMPGPSASDGGVETKPSGESTDGPPPAPTVVVESVSADQTTIPAGASVELRLALSGPAGAGGTPIVLDVSDRSILGAPAVMLVPQGETVTLTVAIGKRPGTVQLSAHVEGSDAEPSTSLQMRVTGLVLGELLPEGRSPAVAGTAWLKLANVSQANIDLGAYRLAIGTGSLDDASAPLQGILPPGGCLLVGGPRSDDSNGSPRYSTVWDFSAVIQSRLDSPGRTVGVALVDATPGSPSSAPVIDGLALLPSADTAPLVGPDGSPLPSTALWPDDGGSLVRLADGRWAAQSTATPAACLPPPDNQ